jgi:hypothetical protein
MLSNVIDDADDSKYVTNEACACALSLMHVCADEGYVLLLYGDGMCPMLLLCTRGIIPLSCSCPMHAHLWMLCGCEGEGEGGLL